MNRAEQTVQPVAIPTPLDNSWGFLCSPRESSGELPGAVPLGNGVWVSRDQGVQYAFSQVTPLAQELFGWWDLFLTAMIEGMVLPGIESREDRVVARWRLARHEELVRSFLSRLSQDGPGGPSDVDKWLPRTLLFLDDWADSYVRSHAPNLEVRHIIGGPLGRRFLSRLLRPVSAWDLNRDEQQALTDITQGWYRLAWEIRPLTHYGLEDHLFVRITGIANSNQLQVELVTDDGDPRALARGVAQWAFRWRPWRRAVSADGLVPVRIGPDEADMFWKEEVPFLLESGIRVEFPKSWRRQGLSARGHLRADESGERTPGLSLRQLSEVNWTIALDDQTLTVEEIRKLAQTKAPLVKLGNQWIVADAGLVRKAQALYERVRKKRLSFEEILRYYLDPVADSIEVEQNADVRRAIMKLREEARITVPIPNFQGVLRPYQVDGVAWLRQRMALGLGALLADDMGLGKTVEVIAALGDYKNRGEWGKPVLLVCPLSVISNWEYEFRRFLPGASLGTHVGLSRSPAEKFADWANGFEVVLTTYDVVARDADAMVPVNWDGIVVDEAQNLKNHRTKRSRALRRLTSGWRIALTGTPVENRLQDLWAEMDFLNPGYLGTEHEFRGQFERPIVRLRDQEAVDRLKRLAEPFVLRRVKTDPLILPDLPDKVEIKEWVGMTREQAVLYQAIVDRLWREMGTAGKTGEMARRGIILTALTHLKQVVNHPESYISDGGGMKGRSGKLDRLEELLSAILDADERVVLFTQYVKMGELLRPYLARKFHTSVAFFHGGLSKYERDKILEQVKLPEGPPIMIASLRAGGVGLNLVAAHHVIHYDRWWNPAVEDQATDRVWRIGQTRLVSVHKLIARGTLEERIDRLIESKRFISNQVVGQPEPNNWPAEMSDEEIRELVELGEDTWIENE